jgi:hypothetical protein
MTKRKNTRVVKKRCNRTLRRQHPQKTRMRSRFSRRRNSPQTRTGTRARARTTRGGKVSDETYMSSWQWHETHRRYETR